MKYFLCSLIVSTIFWVCRNPQYPSYLKDDIINRYISQRDSLGVNDTAEENYKVLKAYASGDYGFLEKLKKQEELTSKFITHKLYWDSCLHQQNLPDVGADEAYRFNYSYVFSTRMYAVTVAKKDGSIKFRCVEYEETPGKGLRYNILKDTTAQVAMKNWNALKSIIDEANFWGMKEDDGIQGLDGDNLDMWG